MSADAPKRVIVGVDGSDGSLRALRWAAGLAAGLGGTVIVVHAFEPLQHLDEIEPGTDFEDLLHATEQRMRDEWCALVTAAGAECIPVIAGGAPNEVLTDTARKQEADIIVVGARGLGTVRGLVLGSTSAKLAHTSKLPVTIVPPGPE